MTDPTTRAAGMIGANQFGGLRIIVSTAATKEAYRFPIKQRSKRLHKKLIKKFGGQVYRLPCALKTPFGLVVHPDIYREMRARSAKPEAQL